MAEYLLLIYGDESKFENSDPKAMEAMMEGHRVFGEHRNVDSRRLVERLHHHRRRVRRDQGSTRRLLRRRGG
jgi:hypothetical protein